MITGLVIAPIVDIYIVEFIIRRNTKPINQITAELNDVFAQEASVSDQVSS